MVGNRSVYIIKLGSTYHDVRPAMGDFDDWMVAGMRADETATSGITVPVVICDVERGASLPQVDACVGIVLTGSHSMVTDHPAWSERVAEWLGKALAVNVPILGICYGHQLLAYAAGGRVGKLPGGIEMGTVSIRCAEAVSSDPLFVDMPPVFPAQTSHSETVLELPPNAVRLAMGDREPHHACRLGENAWGLQFHPEFSPSVMRVYIEHERSTMCAAGQDPDDVRQRVSPTPAASDLLPRFLRLAIDSRRNT